MYYNIRIEKVNEEGKPDITFNAKFTEEVLKEMKENFQDVDIISEITSQSVKEFIKQQNGE